MMDGMSTVFDDPNVTTVGKMFLAGIASAVIGCPPHIKVRGSPDQVDAIRNAITATRDFQLELERPGAMVQDLMDKLQAKNAAAQEFEARLGLPWPL